VILLHGFPDAWFGWENQIGVLAQAGFRVIVPDQRGYNLSDKPATVGAYRMNLLVDDILGLADTLDYNRFHLAGHDFGAMVAWNMTIRKSERLFSLTIANVPHPSVMKRFLRTRPIQMLKSWYALFFQIPALPERILQAGNWRSLMAAMPASLIKSQRQRYRKSWSQPGAITAMLNWYRATLRSLGSSQLSPRIRVPTLILWGQKDPYLSYAMAQASLGLCEIGRLVDFENAGHWVLYDEAKAVNQHLIAHFQTSG
jgi:pimeloyl-ACP methyl ester carboxylesterase